MKIYLVSTNNRVYHDEYDAIVVITESEEDAIVLAKDKCSNFTDNLTVSEIGIAHDGQQRCEVLASFNSG